MTRFRILEKTWGKWEILGFLAIQVQSQRRATEVYSVAKFRTFAKRERHNFWNINSKMNHHQPKRLESAIIFSFQRHQDWKKKLSIFLWGPTPCHMRSSLMQMCPLKQAGANKTGLRYQSRKRKTCKYCQAKCSVWHLLRKVNSAFYFWKKQFEPEYSLR